MKKIRLVTVIGTSISLIALVLSIYWYDWKLTVVITLFILGNNIDNIQ